MDIDKIFDLENYYYYEVCFKELLGKTLKEIIVNKDCSEFKDEFILFRTTENEEFIMFHDQDCLESVWIEDICGDIQKLIGKPLKNVECYHNKNENTVYDSSETYTFYKLSNENEYVTIRWFGSSNGYYSESANFCKKTNKKNKAKRKYII